MKILDNVGNGSEMGAIEAAQEGLAELTVRTHKREHPPLKEDGSMLTQIDSDSNESLRIVEDFRLLGAIFLTAGLLQCLMGWDNHDSPVL